MIPKLRLLEYEIPFTSPFVFNMGGKRKTLKTRQGLLLHWLFGDQSIYTEVAPLPGFSNETLQQCKQQLLVLDSTELSAFVSSKRLYPSVRFAIEAAWYQLENPLRSTAVRSCSLMDKSSESHRIKIKAGHQSIENDVLSLKSALAYLQPHQKLRIDANRTWTIEELETLQQALNTSQIDYVEEPLKCFDHYQPNGLSIAFDESLRELDPLKPVPEIFFTAKTWVLKPMLCGLQRTIELAELAREREIACVLSSSFESNVSLEFYHSLAQDLELTEEQGLDTLKYLAKDLQPAKIKLRAEKVPLADCKEIAQLC
ncbi:enolase C-terminal domain-like protein [Neptuniibacter sp. QD57_21]|uniref:enolase C-terminal domain-like protein n=1 Tax=Neptuniibacter sp. QD57_21 TaxID=3398213 RepID=UPI0039F49C35